MLIINTMPSKYYHRNFKPQHFYHIFNRGAHKNKVFLNKEDYQTFTDILSYYINYPTAKFYSYKHLTPNPYIKVPNLYIDSVRLVAYCLMPNHFHLLLKQTPKADIQTNITNLMRRLTITYSMYFQNKYQHDGSLFQGKYKSVTVDSNQQLLYLSKYIHLNPQKLTNKLINYSYSSYPAYLDKIVIPKWLHPEYVLKLTKKYQQFIQSPVSENEAEKIETLTIDT